MKQWVYFNDDLPKFMKQFKSHLQNAFRKLGIYERLKASCLYDFYWRITDSRIVQ
jgi:hypothetical protein